MPSECFFWFIVAIEVNIRSTIHSVWTTAWFGFFYSFENHCFVFTPTAYFNIADLFQEVATPLISSSLELYLATFRMDLSSSFIRKVLS